MNAARSQIEPPLAVNVYDVLPDGDGVALFSDSLARGRLYFAHENLAIDYATLHGHSAISVVRVFNLAGKVVTVFEGPPGP